MIVSHVFKAGHEMDMTFIDSDGNEQFVAKVNSALNVFQNLNKFCKENGYEFYKVLPMFYDDVATFHIDSYGNRFIVTPCTFEHWDDIGGNVPSYVWESLRNNDK